MSIKAYYSDQAGAPTLNGTVGSLIAVLDAVLVNGYNQVNVSSILRSGSTVTVTTATAHGYENPATNWWNKGGVGNICTIAGAVEAAYNGEWPITYVSATVFTFDIGSATPTTPATGTITTKRAAAGFAKAFSDTNRGVYRSNDITSRRHFLQVNDIADCPNGQSARYAGWRGYENMRGLDDGDYPFPTIIAAGVFGEYICKSSALDSTARHWSIYSDGKTFLMSFHPDQGITSPTAVSNYSYLLGFGDLLSPAPDAYATICSGLSSGSTSYTAAVNCGLTVQGGATSPSPNTSGGWNALARRYTGAAIPVWSTSHLGMSFTQTIAMGFSGGLMFPEGNTNRFQLAQVSVYETSTLGAVLRGVLPIYECGVGVVHSNREIITNIVGREGRQFAYIRCGTSNSSYVGGVYVDLTGVNGKWS